MKELRRLACGLLLLLCSVWAFAKEDVSSIIIDYDNPVNITVAIRSTFVGNVAVKGQTKLLGAYVYNNTGANVNMDIRWAAFQGGRVREIYDGYGYKNLNAGEAMNIKVPCLIGVPSGVYSFFPIVRFEGDPKWYMCGYWVELLEEDYMKDWKLTVLDSYDSPSCSYMANLDWGGSEPDACDIVYEYKLYEPFRVQANLINNTTHILKGKIKLVQQRNISLFWRGGSYLDTDIKDEWIDCITTRANMNGLQADSKGCFNITLQPGETKNLVFYNCMGTTYHDDGRRWAPRLAVYYLSEGLQDIPANWKFVNESMWDCFDSNKNLISFYDGGVNTQSLTFLPMSANIENVNLSEVVLRYSHSSKTISLTNIPIHSTVYATTLEGKNIACFRSNDTDISFTIEAVGIAIVSVVNENNVIVKSFKIIL